MGEKARGLRAIWQREKEKIESLRSLKEQIEALRNQLEAYTRDSDWAKAGEVQYGKIPQLQRQLEAETAELEKIQEGGKMLKEEVDSEDIAEVVSKWTGIPVSRLVQGKCRSC